MSDKPASLPRDGTMEKTVADGVAFLAGGGRSKKPKLPKHTTIARTCEEAKHFVGGLSTTGERQLRKREVKTPKPAPAKKAPKKNLKRLGTMVNTANEGNAFLKRGKKGAAAASSKED